MNPVRQLCDWVRANIIPGRLVSKEDASNVKGLLEEVDAETPNYADIVDTLDPKQRALCKQSGDAELIRRALEIV